MTKKEAEAFIKRLEEIEKGIYTKLDNFTKLLNDLEKRVERREREYERRNKSFR